MKIFSLSISTGVVTALLLLGCAPATGPDVETRKRIDALEAQQGEILKQLHNIRSMLPSTAAASPPAQQPQAVPDLALDGAAMRGRPDAKLTVVEFSDFECPFCGRFTREVRTQLEREYVDTGKIRMVFRNFPLRQIHPHALHAAAAAECARVQNRFWEMHARLFANQQALADSDLLAHARAVGLNVSSFQQCVSAQAPPRVERDLKEGGTAAITGTPTFFIGTMTKDGKVHVLQRIVGAQSYASFKTAIDALLVSP
jgi:protein-disulfide isomerase